MFLKYSDKYAYASQVRSRLRNIRSCRLENSSRMKGYIRQAVFFKSGYCKKRVRDTRGKFIMRKDVVLSLIGRRKILRLCLPYLYFQILYFPLKIHYLLIRSIYVPSRVSTRIISPWLINKGTISV